MDHENADSRQLSGREVYAYMSRVLYNRRCKVDPLYNQLVIASFDERLPGAPPVLAPPIEPAAAAASAASAAPVADSAKAKSSKDGGVVSMLEPVVAIKDGKDVKQYDFRPLHITLRRAHTLHTV